MYQEAGLHVDASMLIVGNLVLNLKITRTTLFPGIALKHQGNSNCT